MMTNEWKLVTYKKVNEDQFQSVETFHVKCLEFSLSPGQFNDNLLCVCISRDLFGALSSIYDGDVNDNLLCVCISRDLFGTLWSIYDGDVLRK